jgi:heterodisulfide reductase subunit C
MTAETDVVEIDKLDRNFKYEIAKEPGGESIMYCFQCGTCTAACPVSPYREDFNPRQIIYKILLGMREEVLTSEFIWYCSGCYSCQERCPQGVTITGLFTAIRNLAMKEGKGPQGHREAVKSIAAMGRLTDVGEFENSMREKLGLPPVDKRPEDYDKILEAAGAKKLAGGE